MARKSQSRTIAGMKVTVHQFEAMYNGRLTVRVSKLFLPTFLAMGAAKADADARSLLPVLTDMFTQLTEDEFERLAVDLLCGTTVVTKENGKDIQLTLSDVDTINLVCAGDAEAMTQMMMFSAEVNLGPFIDKYLRGGSKAPQEGAG